nr:sensor histidine kinase [Acetatifactor sp.]
ILTRSITSRIHLLRNQMMKTQMGIIKKVEGTEYYNDEIGQLIRRYNEMVGKVEELMQEQYVLGQEKTGAELKALQSQINPHFLYNTLDMINWMAQKNETENIRDVVQAMSKFYRLTLSKGKDIVSIGDEIKMCEAYMEIQKRRYRGKILYEVEVDEEIEKYLIPKITLQPFLENAIVHGINEKEDARGVVILNGWMEDGRITLSVTDDGTGMKENETKKTHSGSHYGLDNISKRLELFYGEKIPVLVESSMGVGTCVVINIPIRLEE